MLTDYGSSYTAMKRGDDMPIPNDMVKPDENAIAKMKGECDEQVR